MPKLTVAQRAFLSDLGDEGDIVECLPNEWRTARSLERRGLIRFTSERSFAGFFECQATDAGRAALQQSDQGGAT